MHALEVYVQFPNGLKRPDIAIFCRELSEEEPEQVLTLIPEAVVEAERRLRGQRPKDRSTVLPVAGRQGRGGVRSFYAVGLARPPRRSSTLMEIFAMRLRGQYLT